MLMCWIVAGPLAVAAGVRNDRMILQRVLPNARQGDAAAQYNMGVIYAQGYGVDRDYDKAREWYRKAERQGYAKAAYNLGVMYQKGRGVAVDDAQAAYWFHQAAEMGESAAANNLAVMYARGEGVGRDAALAVIWAARAARLGSPPAVTNLSHLIRNMSSRSVVRSNVAVHARPANAAVVLARLQTGSAVTVVQQRRKWTQVLVSSGYVVGWVRDDALDRTPREQAGDAGAANRQDDLLETSAGAVVMKPSGHDSLSGQPVGTRDSGIDIGVDVANIRAEPNIGAAVVFQARRGEQVTVDDRNDGWAHVTFVGGEHAGRSGWVAGILLDMPAE